MKLKVQKERGLNRVIGPGDGGLRYLSFSRLALEAGSSCSGETGMEEVAIVVLSGTCSVSAGKAEFEGVGNRPNVFSGKPFLVYLPRGTKYTIRASSSLDAAIVGSLSEMDAEPILVRPEDAAESEVGFLNWRRRVVKAFGEERVADKLLVGETINPPGCWSSVPPHKHDRHDPPNEFELEEIYFYKLMPPQGFGLQWIYSPEGEGGRLNEAIVVEEDDLVAIPRGYHPVVAGPGYRLYYLWAMAGKNREYGRFKVDPKHAWLSNCEPIVREFLEKRP
ncbi:MAG: 5-deoxy-glucuronate isomerase [Candidatus Brockarchaeota archaeon]|nr:5-deoxy-glucuronate isomerase [Candidatus Brockarchaeota archaeon]